MRKTAAFVLVAFMWTFFSQNAWGRMTLSSVQPIEKVQMKVLMAAENLSKAQCLINCQKAMADDQSCHELSCQSLHQGVHLFTLSFTTSPVVKPVPSFGLSNHWVLILHESSTENPPPITA